MLTHFIQVCIGLVMILTIIPAASAQRHGHRQMMMPRVPADKLEEARTLHNPLPYSEEIFKKGKALYEGKGTCVNCHGVNGYGDGPGAGSLNPPPRVFRSRGFWKHRTEGEIFWVIKHGSPGTAMIPFGGLLTDEEIWSVMQYEQSFTGRRHHERGGHHMGGDGRHQNDTSHRRGGMGRHHTEE